MATGKIDHGILNKLNSTYSAYEEDMYEVDDEVWEKLNNKGSMGFGVVSSADVSSSVTGNFMMPYVVFKEKVEGGGMPKNIQMRNTTGVRYIEMDFEPDGNYIHFKCTSVSSKDYGASVYVY